LKSLYYCRSKSIQRAEVVNQTVSNASKNQPASNGEAANYEECLSCQ